MRVLVPGYEGAGRILVWVLVQVLVQGIIFTTVLYITMIPLPPRHSPFYYDLYYDVTNPSYCDVTTSTMIL